ncbi:MAG TPA: uroporphyrinogen-III synthase [Candidatus Binatia bacterium]|nr:uroporphyrinogen-III synthase [Candidatus Binatia bacterium]
MEPNLHFGLQGLRVFSFESRRAKEMAELIRRHGGDPVVAPSMREVPLSENRAPLELFQKIEAGQVDLILLLTGVGTRTMVDAVAIHYSREQVAALLGSVPLLARGPKPVAALKELGLKPAMIAPEPNTWREVLAVLDCNVQLKGKRVAVQEYGVTNRELLFGLEARSAEILRVPVYRWALPEDISPLQAVIHEIVEAKADIVVFTSAIQVENVFHVAQQGRLDTELAKSLTRTLLVSVGPVCSEALARFGLKPVFEPEHPKMGFMIGQLAQSAQQLLNTKPATLAGR